MQRTFDALNNGFIYAAMALSLVLIYKAGQEPDRLVSIYDGGNQQIADLPTPSGPYEVRVYDRNQPGKKAVYREAYIPCLTSRVSKCHRHQARRTCR